MTDKHQKGTLRRLYRYLRAHNLRIFLGIVCAAFMALSDAVLGPLAGVLVESFDSLSESLNTGEARVVFDRYLIDLFGNDFVLIPGFSLIGAEEVKHALYMLAVFIVVLMVFKGFFVYSKEYLMSSVVQKVVKQLRDETFSHMLKLKLRYFEHGKTGEIMSRMTNDMQIVEQSLNAMVMVVQAGIHSLIFVTALFILNWRLSIFAVIVFPLSAFILKLFSDAIRNASRKIMAKIADINAFLQESITGIKIIKTYNREDYEHRRFAEKTYQNYALSMRAHRLIAFLKPSNEFLSKVGMNAVLIFCGFLILNQQMEMVTFVAFLALVTMAYKPLKTVGDAQPVISKALASSERIFVLLDEMPEEQAVADAPLRGKVKGKVEFRNVEFSYDGKDPVLRGIDLAVEPGETIALVGPSGAGKSTIINILLKFYEHQSGTLLIDGVDLRRLSRHFIRDQMSLVPQETILFSGSIRDNIRYGRLDATDEEVDEAAKVANAYEFIAGLPEGFDTEIGERGVQLSGGQRQRLSIARAILNDPPILIFDEATSSLDSESEALVKEATGRLMKERTSFVIAHRLSTIRSADRIAVIDKGKVVQLGTHNQLIGQEGLYKSLHDLQLQ
ncbi:ABC transporter ATP-binding protein [candidate division KSB1 bacterium]